MPHQQLHPALSKAPTNNPPCIRSTCTLACCLHGLFQHTDTSCSGWQDPLLPPCYCCQQPFLHWQHAHQAAAASALLPESSALTRALVTNCRIHAKLVCCQGPWSRGAACIVRKHYSGLHVYLESAASRCLGLASLCVAPQEVPAATTAAAALAAYSYVRVAHNPVAHVPLADSL
jgi:hypothetical protein